MCLIVVRAMWYFKWCCTVAYYFVAFISVQVDQEGVWFKLPNTANDGVWASDRENIVTQM